MSLRKINDNQNGNWSLKMYVLPQGSLKVSAGIPIIAILQNLMFLKLFGIRITSRACEKQIASPAPSV